MRRRPQRSKRTDTLLPYTTLVRSIAAAGDCAWLSMNRPIAASRLDTQSSPGFEILFASLPAKWRKTNISARSEEHTSVLQSLLRISYAVFCLKNKTFISFISSLHHFSLFSSFFLSYFFILFS